MKKYGYIEIKFPESFKRELKNMLASFVGADQFYYSDVVGHIQGDVTDNIHLTVFFGLRESELNNEKLRTYLKKLKVDSLSFDKIEIFDGYKSLYKVLTLTIDEESKNKLQVIHDEIKKNYEFDPGMSHYEFKPHVTLAYVNKNFEIPTNPKPFKINVKTKSFELGEFVDSKQ